MKMKNRKISRLNKEKIAMVASSLLIVTACALTGVYINGKSKSGEKEQVVDFGAIEEGTELSLPEVTDEFPQSDQASALTGENSEIPDGDLDLDPAYQETGSDSIINPSLSENTTKETSAAKDAEEKKDDQQEDTSETMSAKVTAFTENDKLAWPVEGNVLLNYSMDQTIYFATLSQYKYNPALIIEGEVGSPVKAPVAGTVREVGENSEIGKYVILDMGGGFELTLGQLENLTVKSGDVVDKEQSLGKVAEPSKYYSVEGSNVYMKLTKNGESINPLNFLS